MELYADIIKEALLFFPVLAFFVTIPYIIHNYRKFGSVLSLRILIVYSFVLYLLCAYFLVILPLPSRQEAALMTGPRLQMIPFHFVADIIKEAGSGGIFSYINNPALFQMLFNVAMTIPFGMYLRYYFQWSRKKTLTASFLLSLFFEFTQLSGLYFYYPRSYRLFDVDDLMANTLTETKIAAISRQNAAWYQHVIRGVSIFLGLYGIPRLVYEFLDFCARYHVITEYGTLFLSGLFAAGYCFYFVFAAVMMALHKPLFYEKMSRTRVISTVRRHL